MKNAVLYWQGAGAKRQRAADHFIWVVTFNPDEAKGRTKERSDAGSADSVVALIYRMNAVY
jgi:alkylhydroperoxidase family enzyme